MTAHHDRRFERSAEVDHKALDLDLHIGCRDHKHELVPANAGQHPVLAGQGG